MRHVVAAATFGSRLMTARIFAWAPPRLMPTQKISSRLLRPLSAVAQPSAVTLGPQGDAVRRNEDSEAVFCVTGANRGIGLEMARQLLSRSKGTIVGVSRSLSPALQQLLDENPSRMRLVFADLKDPGTIAAAGEVMKRDYKRLDVLLNVAGILGDGKTTPGPERSLSAIDADWMLQSFQINAAGPVLLTQALRPLLLPANTARPTAVVANVSARVGSIGDNGMGGWWSYRMSKAALNQATRCMALELRRSRTWVVSLHPGTTDTDLSKPFQANVRPEKLFPVSYTAKQLLDVLDGLHEEHNGGFFAYDGSPIPW